MPNPSSTIGGTLRISPEDFKARRAAGEPVTVLDARKPMAWDSSDEQIRGAIRVNPEQFPMDKSWPRDRLTVVY